MGCQRLQRVTVRLVAQLVEMAQRGDGERLSGENVHRRRRPNRMRHI